MSDQDLKMICKRIQDAIEGAGMSYGEVAEKTGLPKSAVHRYATGETTKVPLDRLQKIAKATGVSAAWIMGWEDQQQPQTVTDEFVPMPLIGDLAAGYDRIALEDWTGDIINIPKSYIKGRKKEDYIMLRVKGDSMYPLYQDGDMVLILRQETQPRAGQVCAVLYNDELSTLKKVSWGFGGVTLEPINPMYQPIEIKGEDLAHFRVIGVPKLLIRDIEE